MVAGRKAPFKLCEFRHSECFRAQCRISITAVVYRLPREPGCIQEELLKESLVRQVQARVDGEFLDHVFETKFSEPANDHGWQPNT